MQLARVVGHAVSTVKHPTLTGWRLLLVQPTNSDGHDDGEPLLVIDPLGAGHMQRVLIGNDGQGARDLVGARNSPARWFVMGLCD